MNYHAIYDRLIQRALTRNLLGYVERHHILPRCMGGSDDHANIAVLTAEEHFVAHVLLVRMHPEVPSLIVAVSKMTSGFAKHRRRKMYGWLRRKHSEYMRQVNMGKGNPAFGMRWITNEIETKRVPSSTILPNGWRFGRPRKPPKPKVVGVGRGYKPDSLRFRADASQLLSRYENGETTNSIGAEFGVSGKAIIQFLNCNFPQRRRFAPREKRAPVV